jgi:HEAT repeat protein
MSCHQREINKRALSPGLKAKLLVYGVAFLMLLVPFLFWKGTWFGTQLSHDEMKEFLQSGARPRDTQHALLQISEAIQNGQSELARQWYPAVLTLAGHPVSEVRNTVAWVMGQDNQQPAFHQSLKSLVTDPNPQVRRNAALALVRFGDASGRTEIVGMLQSSVVQSPRDGTLKYRLQEDDSVSTGTLLARIETGASEPFELRSLLPGFVERKLVADGSPVKAGDAILQLAPSDAQVWEALRALYLVGQPEDLPVIESYTHRRQHLGERTRQQARLTIDAIKKRNPGV